MWLEKTSADVFGSCFLRLSTPFVSKQYKSPYILHYGQQRLLDTTTTTQNLAICILPEKLSRSATTNQDPPFLMAPTPVDTKSRLHDLPTPEPESPFPRTRKPYRFSTLCATVENPDMKDQYGSSSVPIYQTATFKGVGNEYDYTRSGNPTRTHLRECEYSESLDLNVTGTPKSTISPKSRRRVMPLPSLPEWQLLMSFCEY